LAATCLLAGVGLASLWSASAGYALSIGKGAHYFVLRQALYYLPALAAFLVCALVPLERLRAKVGIITIVGLGLLFLPFIPGLGENRNGASRWIDLGFSTFQPSELWKPISVLYLAHIMDRRGKDLSEGAGVLLPPLMLTGFACLVVYMQNDFSTAVVVGAAAVIVFWAAGAPYSFFLGLGAAVTPLAALSVLTSDFRLRRILAFLFPAYEPHGQGYQVLGSIRAIRAGGLVGKGIGLGTLKLASVPEVQSDFVFAAWTEETGFLGVLAFFAIWGLLAWRAFRNAFAEEDAFRSYLGFGLASLLVMEVLVNVAVAAGVVPATGLALPFFSAGGSSLIAAAIICGLLYNLSRGRAEAEAARPEDRPMARAYGVGEDANV
ncbi:MAG TPA: putative peptidoglycan glycosyltransferase FtsW, partial [Rectinemataceae bacterium]|nr:putative peptidoglycan glycosyltransferase FtsW [Rectinemataceae bacterium]